MIAMEWKGKERIQLKMDESIRLDQKDKDEKDKAKRFHLRN